MHDQSLFFKLNIYGYSDQDIEEVKDCFINLKPLGRIDTDA